MDRVFRSPCFRMLTAISSAALKAVSRFPGASTKGTSTPPGDLAQRSFEDGREPRLQSADSGIRNLFLAASCSHRFTDPISIMLRNDVQAHQSQQSARTGHRLCRCQKCIFQVGPPPFDGFIGRGPFSVQSSFRSRIKPGPLPDPRGGPGIASPACHPGKPDGRPPPDLPVP